MKKVFAIMLAGAMAFSLVACGGGNNAGSGDAAGDGEATGTTYKIAVVPKMTSIAWFQRMEEGVTMYNEANGTEIYYGGSEAGDGQAAYVESLLADDWDAICVVPFDIEALEPVLEKAKEQGIVVITHEAASMPEEYRDFDVEAFNNIEYGKHFMEQMGEAVNGTGKYIQLVGSLGSTSHMEWAQGSQDYQTENYPDMELVGVYETADDQTQAYNTVKEVLTANPDIIGIQGSAMADVAGAAQAVEELGLAGKVTIVGTSLVSVSGDYVTSGTINSISFWDPAMAGQAMIELAIATLDGTAVDGLSLPVEGYETLTLEGDVFTASAWVDVTTENVGDYDF